MHEQSHYSADHSNRAPLIGKTILHNFAASAKEATKVALERTTASSLGFAMGCLFVLAATNTSGALAGWFSANEKVRIENEKVALKNQYEQLITDKVDSVQNRAMNAADNFNAMSGTCGFVKIYPNPDPNQPDKLEYTVPEGYDAQPTVYQGWITNDGISFGLGEPAQNTIDGFTDIDSIAQR